MFSAALRCGLIEAERVLEMARTLSPFSAALRCGLIEAPPSSEDITYATVVFRSITLRPH